MNRITLTFVIAALGSAGLALAMRPSDTPPAQFEDTGTVLFPDFTDPTLATSLEVVEWNDDAASLRRFKVEQKDGMWVIPSHHDYPADATERMGKAAASFVGVKRDIYYGDDPKQLGAFGLLDPEDPAGEAEEKGRRITIRDGAGTVLVDILVGKPIPDKQGYFYVRLPDDKRVYGAKMELDISTNFADWIEKDLLHIDHNNLVAMIYDPYTVDEAQGRVVGQGAIDLRYAPKEEGSESKEWKLGPESKPPGGKQLDAAKVRTMAGAIDRLQIVGVRARPEQLTLPVLQAYGFFVNPRSGRLFGNEGEVHVADKDGVVYTLFFGEVTFDSGLALTAGQEGEGEDGAGGSSDEAGGSGGEAGGGSGGDEAGGAEADKPASGAGNRYLFVDVHFDPKFVAEDGDAEAGKKRAEELRKRFDRWFFVISDSSFKQIHKARDELYKDAK